VDSEAQASHNVLEDARITTWKLADATADEVQRMLSLDRARGSGASDPMGIGYEGHLVQIEDTIEAIETGRAPLVDGAEGRKAIEIIAAVYRSQRTGHAVSLPLV
jgi:UDP-N-acetyl-2-amino-2-deoxyglucuronate dehydrogenase